MPDKAWVISEMETCVSNSGQVNRSVSGQREPMLDAVNLNILDILRDDGRISMSSLAEKVNISRASAYNRVDQLTSSGVISGFSAIVKPDRVGLHVCALIFVTVHPQSWHRFREGVQEMPEVEYCCVTSGEHDAMLLVRALDIGGVHDFVTSVLAARAEVKSVVSVVVLDEVIRRPYLLPTDIPDHSIAAGRLGMTRFVTAGNGRDVRDGN